MKFNNRLEAMRWMCNNPKAHVKFDAYGHAGAEIWLSYGGMMEGDRALWFGGWVADIRTADHKEPEPEIDWNVICNDQARPDLCGKREYTIIISELIKYHEHLMRFLEAKFEAKK